MEPGACREIAMRKADVLLVTLEATWQPSACDLGLVMVVSPGNHWLPP